MIPLPSGGTAKSSRILAGAKAVGTGNYGIAEEEEDLFQALESYDPASDTEHDDLPDGFAYGIIAWAQAGVLIQEHGRFNERLALLQGYEPGISINQTQWVPY